MRSILAAAAIAATTSCALPALAADPAAKDIAPSGTLRAAINFGNPVLAQKDPKTGEPRGVSVDLANELGKRLGVPVKLVTFTEAVEVVEAGHHDGWDVAFVAIDPKRAEGLVFTAAYVVIEGAYLVPKTSTLTKLDQVDRAGTKIGVAKGSAYDLYLSRAIKQAELVRQTNTPMTIDTMAKGGIQVVASVKQPLDAYAKDHPEVRVLPGRFMAIEQAMALPKAHEAGLAYVRTFVEDAKASGFVAQALKASNQEAAEVAPPAPKS